VGRGRGLGRRLNRSRCLIFAPRGGDFGACLAGLIGALAACINPVFAGADFVLTMMCCRVTMGRGFSCAAPCSCGLARVSREGCCRPSAGAERHAARRVYRSERRAGSPRPGNRHNFGGDRRHRARPASSGSLGTTLSANQFRLRATQYPYRWPGTAPASTPCPREGAGPCPPIPCGGCASPDENGAAATLRARH
jgi:hypothetical protein